MRKAGPSRPAVFAPSVSAVGDTFPPFFALRLCAFFLLTLYITYIVSTLFRVDRTSSNVVDIAGWDADSLRLWVCQIRFWTATIAFYLWEQSFIPWKYLTPMDSVHIDVSVVSISPSIHIFHYFSLPHSRPSSWVSGLVLTGYRVASMRNIRPVTVCEAVK